MALDDDDIKKVQELIAAGLKTGLEGVPSVDDVGKIVTQSLGKLDLAGQIKTALEGAKPDDKGGDDKSKGGKGDQDARFEALEAKVREAEERREAAERDSRIQRRDSELREALVKNGIPADRVPMVLPYLRELKTAEGNPVIDFDESGKPLWRMQRKGFVDELDLGTAVEEWSRSDAAKHFLPAREGGGIGGNAGRRSAGGTGKLPRSSDGTLDLSKLAQTALQGMGAQQIDEL